jgi:hypothetical protein
VFWNWSGDLTGSTNPATLTVDGFKAVTAVYGGDIPSTPPTPDPTPAPTPSSPCAFAQGDVNGNLSVDIVDALVVAQYYVGLNPSSFQACAADVNQNGTIDIVDALLIARCYVGLGCTF